LSLAFISSFKYNISILPAQKENMDNAEPQKNWAGGVAGSSGEVIFVGLIVLKIQKTTPFLL